MSTSERLAPRLLEFFSAKDLNQLAPNLEGPRAENIEFTFCEEADKDAFVAASAVFGRHIKNAAFDFEGCGLHIGVFEFGAGLATPLHSHSDNCVYYVERGSIIMGNREIGPGEGVLVRKDQPYAFTVGPNGVRLLEFTTAARGDAAILDRNIAGWKERVDKAAAKLESH